MSNFSQIQKRSLNELVAGIKDSSTSVSKEAGIKLLKAAASYGCDVRTYLNLAVNRDEDNEQVRSMKAAGLSGYEMAKVALGLPTRNDYSKQITLSTASDTFAQYPGARAMFKYVVDDVLRWTDRQAMFEKVEPLLAGSRTIQGREMVRNVIWQNGKDNWADIAELGEVPVRDVKTSDYAVQFGKIGSGIRMSYEFTRNASLDVLTPFAARIARELEIEKVKRATAIMINGDGTQYHEAAPVAKQSDYDASAKAGEISFNGLIAHILACAKKGTPITHIAGDYAAYAQWIKMFAPTANVTNDAENLAARGLAPRFAQMNVFGNIEFVLDSAVPNGKLLCYSKPETMEELISAGSDIEEDEKNILNQSTTYVHTLNIGYALLFGDTRSLYDYSK